MADETVVTAPKAAKPDHHLVVIHPFGSYKKGDVITDADEVSGVLDSEHHRLAHKVFPK